MQPAQSNYFLVGNKWSYILNQCFHPAPPGSLTVTQCYIISVHAYVNVYQFFTQVYVLCIINKLVNNPKLLQILNVSKVFSCFVFSLTELIPLQQKIALGLDLEPSISTNFAWNEPVLYFKFCFSESKIAQRMPKLKRKKKDWLTWTQISELHSHFDVSDTQSGWQILWLSQIQGCVFLI